MSLLPGQILPPSVPLGRVNDDGSVVIDTNWWLLIYNLCTQSLSTDGGLPASALQALEVNDQDIPTSDVPTIVQQIANLQALLPEEELGTALQDIANALMMAIAQYDEGGTFGGFARPSAQVGLTAITGSSDSAIRADGAPALDQSIGPTWTGNHTFAPTAGIAITVDGASGQVGSLLSHAPAYIDNNLHPLIAFNSAGTNYGLIQNDSSNNWSLATGISNVTLGTPVIKWNATGNVAIPAPTSGDALTLSNVSGGNALTVNGTVAGTAVVKANTQATTGAQTATFSAANKPGAANGSPQKWWPINADGTTYYIPLFS